MPSNLPAATAAPPVAPSDTKYATAVSVFTKFSLVSNASLVAVLTSPIVIPSGLGDTDTELTVSSSVSELSRPSLSRS